MHEGLIWVSLSKPEGAVHPPTLTDKVCTLLPTNKSICLVSSSQPDSLHFHLPHLFYMGAAKHTPEHTYTHKAHISIHSCRAVRSNLDSCREWIVMQRGGRWAQTGCQRAAARLCPTCLSLWSPALHNPSLTGIFFLSHHQTHNSYLSFPHQTDPRPFRAKYSFRRLLADQTHLRALGGSCVAC